MPAPLRGGSPQRSASTRSLTRRCGCRRRADREGAPSASDGALVESVLMRYPARGSQRERHTLCISSQAGCAVGCPFCATGELGSRATSDRRDRRPGPPRRAPPRGRRQRLTNVVFMGMGEPLLNLDRVLEAVDALNDPRAVRAGGAAHHGVDVGVVPGIRRLTALGPQFTLAVSLHAARDALRDVLVPLNRRWPIAEVVAAARDHARRDRPAGELRGDDDRAASTTPTIDAAGDGRAAARRPRPRQPDPDEPGRPHAVGRPARAGDRARSRRRCAGPASRRRSGGTAAQEIGAACGQLAAERAGEPPAAGGRASSRAARSTRARPRSAASGATSRAGRVGE